MCSCPRSGLTGLTKGKKDSMFNELASSSEPDGEILLFMNKKNVTTDAPGRYQFEGVWSNIVFNCAVSSKDWPALRKDAQRNTST